MATLPTIETLEADSTILQRMGLIGACNRLMAVARDASGEAPAKADARARRRSLNGVRDFLVRNDLPVTATTLRAAHDACSGGNSVLERSIEQRRLNREPITDGWLEETLGAGGHQADRSIEELARQLAHGIDELSRATISVRQATSEYGDELERRVDDLNGSHDTADLIANLTEFAKAMLARSRQTEEELRAREAETAALRENLDRARRDAEVDYLTGLPNRRAFEDVLQAEHREARKAGRALSVAFCDIDRFKAINDSHGHEAGDRVIREIAETLSKLSGKDCFLARHGGEEFVMLFRGMTTDAALMALDDTRDELARRRMINRRTDKPFGVITFSGGIADASHFDDPREALAAADRALYLAKESGRNRICLADASSTGV